MSARTRKVSVVGGETQGHTIHRFSRWLVIGIHSASLSNKPTGNPRENLGCDPCPKGSHGLRWKGSAWAMHRQTWLVWVPVGRSHRACSWGSPKEASEASAGSSIYIHRWHLRWWSLSYVSGSGWQRNNILFLALCENLTLSFSYSNCLQFQMSAVGLPTFVQTKKSIFYLIIASLEVLFLTPTGP